MDTISTPRLTLRMFRETDLDAYAAMSADPEVMRHIGQGGPIERDLAWRGMAAFVGHWALRGIGMWAIEERATGRLIGRAGFLHPEGWPGCEVGWLLARDAWGRGLAFEAVSAAIAHGRAALGVGALISLIRPDNTRSARLAERLGAWRAGSIDFLGGAADVYRYPEPGAGAAGPSASSGPVSAANAPSGADVLAVDALPVEPLTAEAFAAFGDVIEATSAARHHPINDGLAERYHDLARLDTQAGGGRPLLNIFRAKGQALPRRIEALERHRLGSQAFVALSPQRFLVVVAPPADAPDPAQLRAFLASPGQGVNYAAGTWHHPLIALDSGGDFLVIDRGDPGEVDDCTCAALPAVRVIRSLP